MIQNLYPMLWNAVGAASRRMTVAMNWPMILKDIPKLRMTTGKLHGDQHMQQLWVLV